MARREIQWVAFCFPARLSTGSSVQPALASSDATKLFKDDIDGIPHVVVEDASLHAPASIPWSNVSSVGWVPVPPPCETVLALRADRAAEAKGRFVKKVPAVEPES